MLRPCASSRTASAAPSSFSAALCQRGILAFADADNTPCSSASLGVVLSGPFRRHSRRPMSTRQPYLRCTSRPVRLLPPRLPSTKTKFLLTFRSRASASAQSLEPRPGTVKRLAKEGVEERMAIVTPGFFADCLETLEELAFGDAEIFKRNSSGDFTAVPCLNDGAPGMQVIHQLTKHGLKSLSVRVSGLRIKPRTGRVTTMKSNSSVRRRLGLLPPPCGGGLRGGG